GVPRGKRCRHRLRADRDPGASLLRPEGGRGAGLRRGGVLHPPGPGSALDARPAQRSGGHGPAPPDLRRCRCCRVARWFLKIPPRDPPMSNPVPASPQALEEKVTEAARMQEIEEKIVA